MITTAETAELVAKYGRKKGDTASPEVQVALITRRINNLAPHFEKNPYDYNSNRGLMKLVGQRKRLLRFLAEQDDTRYQEVIKSLGLRK